MSSFPLIIGVSGKTYAGLIRIKKRMRSNEPLATIVERVCEAMIHALDQEDALKKIAYKPTRKGARK